MYFSNLNYCLKMFDLVGVHPEKGYTFMQILLYLCTLCFWQLNVIYLAILYIVYKEGDITVEDITSALETFFVMFHGVIKLSFLFFQRENIRDLLHRMKHFWKPEEVVNEQQRKAYLKQLKFLKLVFIVYNITCAGTATAFTCKIFFMEGDILTFTTFKPDWIPFHALLFYEGVASVFAIYFPILGMDMFTMTTFMLTKMQFEMLNQEVGSIFNEGAKLGENEDAVKKRIKKCVDHHNFLLDYVNRINRTFSIGMLAYVAIIVLSMCVEMYIVSTQNSAMAIKGIMYVADGLFEYAVCYCIPSQAITDAADRTADFAYFNNWHKHLTASMQIAQKLIIGRAQKMVLILAGGFIKVDLEACLETIKTMVSYAMFIRTMGIVEE